MTMESAAGLVVTVDVLVDRLRAPRLLADLELDEIPEFQINAASLPLPGLGVLLGRHATVGP